mgnify:FL=1|jgi:hypothetical protein|tara:strand:- start:149 stop:322 length:174 start_codon:yes stop_codon:yes gene_type:complete
MIDFNKMTISIEKLQPNSEYTIDYNDGTVNETLFNSINWISTNSLTWTAVKEEMDKL